MANQSRTLAVCLCRSTFTLCFAAAPLLALAADKFPIGGYTAGGHTLIFQKNGQFRVVEQKKMLVEGEYSVKGDEVSFIDKRGIDACLKTGEEMGKYGWKLAGEMLSFNKLADTCSGRSEELPMQPWKREQR